MDIVDIYMSPTGAWEWFVYKKDKSGRLMVIAYSPMTPDGEIGSVMMSELKSIAAIRLELSESLPPSGFHWEE